MIFAEDDKSAEYEFSRSEMPDARGRLKIGLKPELA